MYVLNILVLNTFDVILFFLGCCPSRKSAAVLSYRYWVMSFWFSGPESTAADICRSATETVAVAAAGLPALLPAHWSAVAGVKASAAETDCYHLETTTAGRSIHHRQLIVVFICRPRCCVGGKTSRLHQSWARINWAASRPSSEPIKDFWRWGRKEPDVCDWRRQTDSRWQRQCIKGWSDRIHKQFWWTAAIRRRQR